MRSLVMSLLSHDLLHKNGNRLINVIKVFKPFTAKDAIWRPRGITHFRICLSAYYNFLLCVSTASALILKNARLYRTGY